MCLYIIYILHILKDRSTDRYMDGQRITSGLKASFQRSLWLGQEGEVRGATTTSDGATAAVEEGHVDPMLLPNLQNWGS